MKSAPILVMLAACGLLGWYYPELTAFASGGASGEQPVIQAGAAPPAVQAEQFEIVRQNQQQQQWLAGETILQRQSDGHFYAEVTAGTTPLRMMVDTGASVVALTGEDARAIGLQWDDIDVVAVGEGASGTVYGVNTRLPRLQLDGIELHDVAAIIVPEGLFISLLGQSFLSQVTRVEIVDDEMVLGG